MIRKPLVVMLLAGVAACGTRDDQIPKSDLAKLEVTTLRRSFVMLQAMQGTNAKPEGLDMARDEIVRHLMLLRRVAFDPATSDKNAAEALCQIDEQWQHLGISDEKLGAEARQYLSSIMPSVRTVLTAYQKEFGGSGCRIGFSGA